MKSGLSLRQINQILRNAFFLENRNHHVVVTAGAGKGTLECTPSSIGEIADVAGDLIGHHERQIGMRGFDLRLRFDLHVGIG